MLNIIEIIIQADLIITRIKIVLLLFTRFWATVKHKHDKLHMSHSLNYCDNLYALQKSFVPTKTSSTIISCLSNT